jgi:hypothetical protein
MLIVVCGPKVEQFNNCTMCSFTIVQACQVNIFFLQGTPSQQFSRHYLIYGEYHVILDI